MVTVSVRGSMLHNKQTWRSYFTFCLLSMLSFPFHHILTASDLFSHSLLFFSLIVPPTLILCMRIDYFLSVGLRFSCDDWHEPYFRNLFLCTDLDLPRKRQLLQEFLFLTKKTTIENEHQLNNGNTLVGNRSCFSLFVFFKKKQIMDFFLFLLFAHSKIKSF